MIDENQRNSKWTILVGGNIINESFNGYERRAVLWIRNGKIHKISHRPDGRYPEGSEVIDISGKYVLPGLIDMHTHIMGMPGELELYLRCGVTSIRDVGSVPQKTIPIRNEIATGKRQGPRIFTYGYLIDDEPPRFPALSRGVRDVEACRAVIEEEALLGVDGIKLLYRLPYRLIDFCIREAHSKGLPVAGHFGEVALDSYAVQLGIDSIEHVPPLAKDLVPVEKRFIIDDYGHLLGPFKAWSEEVDLQSCEVSTVIGLFKTHGTLLVPTLTTYKVLLPCDEGEMQAKLNSRGIPDEMISMWKSYDYSELRNPRDTDIVHSGFEKCLQFVKLFYDEVGRIGIGTDAPNPLTPPGISLHFELELLASAGIPSSDLLRSATFGASKFLGVQNTLGNVSIGKTADLLVLEADPLQDITNTRRIHMVFSNGKSVKPIQVPLYK